MSDADAAKLVEPWLGKDAMVKDLPLPRLIDATIEPGAHIDFATLQARLQTVAPDSNVDDHTRWIARLQSLANTIIYAAYAVLALIALATAAAVSFATRAGLEAHHDIVALLHQMGAHSGFIARAFECGGASRHCGVAAPDGRAFRLHRARLRMALSDLDTGGVGGGRGACRCHIPAGGRAGIRRCRSSPISAAIGA
jgi:cell division protein FtsX